MAEGSYGVMVHYLISPPGDTPAAKTENLPKRMIGPGLGIHGQRLLHFFQQIVENGREGFAEVAEMIGRRGRTL